MPRIWKSACFASSAFKSLNFVQNLENFAWTCVRVSVRFRSSVYSERHMGPKNQDGYYAEKCHLFSTLELKYTNFKTGPNKSKYLVTPTLLTDADSRTNTNLKRLCDLSLFFPPIGCVIFFFLSVKCSTALFEFVF